MSQTYYNYKAQGICAKCGKKPAQDKRLFCKECVNELVEFNRIRNKFRKDNNLCRTCGMPVIKLSLCPKCKDRNNLLNKKRTAQIKLEVFATYGNICTCCGENAITALQIDHIEGITTGHDDKTGSTFYRWLKKNNYPKSYQLLCGSCNWSKGLFGICPHQQNIKNLIAKCVQVGSSV